MHCKITQSEELPFNGANSMALIGRFRPDEYAKITMIKKYLKKKDRITFAFMLLTIQRNHIHSSNA